MFLSMSYHSPEILLFIVTTFLLFIALLLRNLEIN